MTDHLIAELRVLAEYIDAAGEAADALEAQARRIAELEANWAAQAKSIDVLDAEIAEQAARIAELEAALKPFADAYDEDSYDGPNHDLDSYDVAWKHLRAARAAYRGEKE